MQFKLKTLAATASFAVLAACSTGPSYEYFRVESRFVSSAQDVLPPEIIQTPAYRDLETSGLTVAVRAPDRCSNATAAQATGEAAAAGSIIQTNCGVEMGEIERALTRAGYNVISWNIMSREMARDAAASEVAMRMGAQVLFQINSLENSRQTLGQDARWERSYFRTDARVSRTTPLPLDENSRAVIRNNYLSPMENRQNTRAYAVTLDASAVWVPTGQSIWYYRWTKARSPDTVSAAIGLNLSCIVGYGFSQCQSFNPPRAAQRTGLDVAAGESVGLSASQRPEDVERAIYAELYRDVVADFVGKFASGNS